MNTCKLIFRNVCKNIRDYLIYFLTLTLSVSLFYAFNSISDQPAFSNMGMTGTLLYRQLGIMLSTLSTMIAVVLAFLILYANQFLLKRRKKELGVYMMLGMKKGRISRLFAGETLCVGIIALGTGLLELQLQWNVSVYCCCIAEPPGNHGWRGDFTACRR